MNIANSNKFHSISIHIGINHYSPNYYKDINDLKGCENDANNMLYLAKLFGYNHSFLFISPYATFDNFKLNITLAKEIANEKGKYLQLLYTHSSHGTYTIVEQSNKMKRITGLCFYDRIVWDYEMKEFLNSVLDKNDVLFWITDSCYSEGNIDFKAMFDHINDYKYSDIRPKLYIKSENAHQTINYEKAISTVPMKCNIMTFWSCTEYQVSWDLSNGGLFTNSIYENRTKVLNNYQFFLTVANSMSKSGLVQDPKFSAWRGSNIDTNKGIKGLSYCQFLTTL